MGIVMSTTFSSSKNIFNDIKSFSTLDNSSICNNADSLSLTSIFYTEITNTIFNDEFEDGFISNSELLMKKYKDSNKKPYIKQAIMDIYLKNYNNSKMLQGVLKMFGCLSFKEAFPEGQFLAYGLLGHPDDSIIDSAIQLYEIWNSKLSLELLDTYHFKRKWLQDYKDKVVESIKISGDN